MTACCPPASICGVAVCTVRRSKAPASCRRWLYTTSACSTSSSGMPLHTLGGLLQALDARTRPHIRRWSYDNNQGFSRPADRCVHATAMMGLERLSCSPDGAGRP